MTFWLAAMGLVCSSNSSKPLTSDSSMYLRLRVMVLVCSSSASESLTFSAMDSRLATMRSVGSEFQSNLHLLGPSQPPTVRGFDV